MNILNMEFNLIPVKVKLNSELKRLQWWCKNDVSDTDWLIAFLKRRPSLSVHRPEEIICARIMNVNRTNVNLSKVLHACP